MVGSSRARGHRQKLPLGNAQGSWEAATPSSCPGLVLSFSCPLLVWEGSPKFLSLPRVGLPQAPCHARSQRSGSRNPALEGHDAKDEDEEPQHDVSRTRKGGLTLPPHTHTLLSPEGTVGWFSRLGQEEGGRD